MNVRKANPKIPEAYMVRGKKGRFVPVIERDGVTVLGKEYCRIADATLSLGKMLVKLSCDMRTKADENSI